MLLMAGVQNPDTNPMKETFEDDEYSVENEPQKQVFNKEQPYIEPKEEEGFNLDADSKNEE